MGLLARYHVTFGLVATMRTSGAARSNALADSRTSTGARGVEDQNVFRDLRCGSALRKAADPAFRMPSTWR